MRISWQDGASSTEIEGMIDQLKGWIKTMYDLTPHDGAYFNEVRSGQFLFLLNACLSSRMKTPGILVRDQLARDLLRISLFDSQEYQEQV
jgi:hypothetical protein